MRDIEGGFGIYVHWPFCAAKCPYCDFNSHVRKNIDEAAWRKAYAAELRHWTRALGDQRPRLDSIFFGGGTPSLMAPETVSSVLGEIAKAFPLAPDIEITLEANPTSADAERFRFYALAGVNRLSLGVQSLIDADLKALGRWHSAAEALAAVALARESFPRISFDLITARPHQTPALWREELAQALSHAPDHLSLYHLTIEPNTPFAAAYARGALQIPSDDTQAAIYEITQELCEGAGLAAYEISNHARRGEESRHNLIYWRYGEYLGIGPGAHGRVTLDEKKHATAAIKKPEDWLARVEAEGHGIERDEWLDADAQADEFLLMGMRLAEGIDAGRYARLKGSPLNENAVARLEASGMIGRRNAGIAATAKGRLVLNSLIVELARGA